VITFSRVAIGFRGWKAKKVNDVVLKQSNKEEVIDFLRPTVHMEKEQDQQVNS
jgi:hypothetical protein